MANTLNPWGTIAFVFGTNSSHGLLIGGGGHSAMTKSGDVGGSDRARVGAILTLDEIWTFFFTAAVA